jgi:transposase
MGKPYSQELREAIIKAVAGGCTVEQAAKDHEVSLSTVTRLLRRSRLTGNVKPDKFGGRKPYALKGHEEQIKRWIREQPDITLKQLRARLLKQGIAVSKSSLARFRDHVFPEEAAARKAWREELSRLCYN